jgi:hypothetical protein
MTARSTGLGGDNPVTTLSPEPGERAMGAMDVAEANEIPRARMGRASPHRTC